jgi:tRNA A37 threonylcarbamoyladenosine dehydratase
MIPSWQGRTQLLLGEKKIEKLMNSHVLVVGLGGVGGICAEMIARSGVGEMTIVDGDVVEESNRNRQIPALFSTENMAKSEVMAQRIRDINPAIKLNVINDYLREEEIEKLLDSAKFDYVCDCIDTLSSKVSLIKQCLERKLKIVSAMGAGGKIDPSQVQIADISKSYNCKLAFYVRKKLHQSGIRKGFNAVFSTELADRSNLVILEKGVKRSVIGTISYMPAIFGCTVASVVIRDLANNKK